MPPEIGPIGDSQGSNYRVQPINWSEKVNLNERRVPLPQEAPSGATPEDLFIKSDEPNFWGEPSLGGDAPEPAKGGAPEHGSFDEPVASSTADAPDAPVTKSLTPNELHAAPEVQAPGDTHASRTPIAPEPYSPPLEITNQSVPTQLSDMSSTDLQAKRAALIKAGTGHSILELESVNQELARRGLFRNALTMVPESTAVPEPVGSKPAATGVGDITPEAPAGASSNSFFSPLGKVATFGLGALGVVGGMFQIRHGVDELNNGNYFEGGMTSLSGVCNTTAGGAAFFSRLPFANTLATRAGGLGAIFDGGNLLVKGYQNGNDIQMLDGGVRTGLGATMLAGVPVGWCAGSGYAGWSAGRFIGERKVYGNETVDDLVTRGLYNMFFAPGA